jgi:hypothetical protein
MINHDSDPAALTASRELELPMLNILLQYLLTNLIDSNILYQYAVDNLIELYFTSSLS